MLGSNQRDQLQSKGVKFGGGGGGGGGEGEGRGRGGGGEGEGRGRGGGGEGEGIVSLLMVRQKWCLGDRSYGVIMTSGFSPCDHGQGNGPS